MKNFRAHRSRLRGSLYLHSMNKPRFRRLLDTPATSTQSRLNETPSSLTTRRCSIGDRVSRWPRTSLCYSLFFGLWLYHRRSIATSGGVDFARHLAERDAARNSPTAKKFSSTPVRKGTKYTPGYQVRTQLHISSEALKEMVNMGQMDIATFESLRGNFVGEDLRDSHLLKGFDQSF